MGKSVSAIILSDLYTSNPHSDINPYLIAIEGSFPTVKKIVAGNNYYQAIVELRSIKPKFDVIVTLLRSGLLFEHPNLFTDLDQPVVVIEHDACQNSIESSIRYGAWMRYFKSNPVSAMCVSGHQPLRDLKGNIPGIVKYIPKGAPERFLNGGINISGRYCLFGSVQLGMYKERKALFDAIRAHTVYDRVIRKWSMYQASYFFSRIWRNTPDVSRIDFSYTEMPNVLQYYSAAIICDRGLREPMMKHFEVAALGLVPFRDDECVEELEEHGYRDGESMVVYENADDLKEKMRFYANRLSLMNQIQYKAREVTRQHTWEKRAKELVNFIATEIL